jgi:hypothetical protein
MRAKGSPTPTPTRGRAPESVQTRASILVCAVLDPYSTECVWPRLALTHGMDWRVRRLQSLIDLAGSEKVADDLDRRKEGGVCVCVCVCVCVPPCSALRSV